MKIGAFWPSADEEGNGVFGGRVKLFAINVVGNGAMAGSWGVFSYTEIGV